MAFKQRNNTVCMYRTGLLVINIHLRSSSHIVPHAPCALFFYYISFILCLLDPLFVIHKYRSLCQEKNRSEEGIFFYVAYHIESHLGHLPHFHAQRIKNTSATKSNARVDVWFLRRERHLLHYPFPPSISVAWTDFSVSFCRVHNSSAAWVTMPQSRKNCFAGKREKSRFAQCHFSLFFQSIISLQTSRYL